MTLSTFTITQTGGTWSVVKDGEDISHQVDSISVTMTLHDVARVTLTFPSVDVIVDGAFLDSAPPTRPLPAVSRDTPGEYRK